MNKQDNIVSAIHTAVSTSRAAATAVVNTWEALRTECEHYHKDSCSMNSENIKTYDVDTGQVGCTFGNCPYTNT